MAVITRRLLIAGRVQGFGYRWSMVEAARRLGVAGWVRNLDNGRVEAMVEGEENAVIALLDRACHGLAGARVSGVASELGDRQCSGFEPRANG